MTFIFVFIPAFTACSVPDGERISECAEGFASGYFNLDFDEAAGYCTPGSKKWLMFKASNITRQDIEAFNANPRDAGISVVDVELLDDSSARAWCVVENAVATDSLEQKHGRIVPRQKWIIPLVKRDKKWFVKMEAPLQNAD